MSDDAVVRIQGRLADIGKVAWDACAGADNPFVSYDFLQALEESGSVSARAGWAPHHIVLDDAQGATQAVMPLYLKSHSQGEYVFDHAWANAYERAGGDYYPKLQCAVPFTPVSGPRLMARADAEDGARQTLLAGALTLCQRLKASSLHVTFPEEADWALMGKAGFLQRQDQQYHWYNQGYGGFDDFLAALSSGHRKTIRRERRDARAEVEVVALTGADIREEHWDAFFGFYLDTGQRKWGSPYLNRLFFSMIGERMADKILLIMARQNGRWVAGALNFIGADALYGRNWGSLVHVPFLHFELCYYAAIEQAILMGLSRVEAGAQGEHKIARGYLPSPVYSAHWIADPALREPVARYLTQERSAVEAEMVYLSEAYSPFKQGTEG